MRKSKSVLIAGLMTLSLLGFKSDEFSLGDLKNYEREYKSESVGACSVSSTKTYEDYRAITDTSSKQYRFIQEHMTVDETTGMLYDEDGFIGVAMAWGFGDIGTRYYVVLDTGIIIPVVKVDAKAFVDAPNGCSHAADASVIEFVIDSGKAYEYFGGGNGLALNGNFNNYEFLNGHILDIELVLDEKLEEGVVYEVEMADTVKETETSDGIQVVEGGY
ncbi:MAG: hypothetical protein IKF51_08435 [Solobacterium sp.]|nr:hypothetical protein [Solobacterium sp.]